MTNPKPESRNGDTLPTTLEEAVEMMRFGCPWAAVGLAEQDVAYFERRMQAAADLIEKSLRSEIGQGMALVPREIDRMQHANVLGVWNDCMANYETLEMTWPKLVDAIAMKGDK